MPHIDPQYLNCVAYLYKDKDSAKAGISHGGSGFLMTIPFGREINGENRSHVYVITNSHVVRDFSSYVIRLNDQFGKRKVIPKKYEDWIDDWDDDDLAACMLDDTEMRKYKWIAPQPWDLFTEDEYENGLINIGDDVMMFGRFIGFDGRQQNLPVVRFGTVSMWPIEPIKHPSKSRKNLWQDSFLVECHSIPGTSGSPVFTTRKDNEGYTIPDKLLGVVWGYPPYRAPILRNKDHNEFANIYAPVPSGVAVVIPAWNIMNFLNRSDLVNDRKKIEKKAEDEEDNQ